MDPQSQMMNNPNYVVWAQPPPPPPPENQNPMIFQRAPFFTRTNWNRNDFQPQNSAKPQRFYPKKNKSKNKKKNHYYKKNRDAPLAPRNTTSFLIRAKKSGGIASLVSPCPVTPAILTTPIFSPSREVLVDTAKEEWGVDGYGSMKGLIPLRNDDDEDVDDDDGVELLEHESLSRFEMIKHPNPNSHSSSIGPYGLENKVDDQDFHIARLEEESLTLKERMFLMERELEDFRRRMLYLEGTTSINTTSHAGALLKEDPAQNASDNEDVCSQNE